MAAPLSRDTPEISVVLATYNRCRTLPRAIASVLAQRDVAFELIVVDDASRDGTAAYLATLDDPRIRVITCASNGGPSAARNRGLAAARAEFVAFLDSDDAYRPNRLAAPLAAFTGDRGLVATLSSAVKHDRNGPREAIIPAVKLAPAAFEWALICDLVPVEATSITVRRTAALGAGGFCERLRLTEDREFLIRLARHGGGALLPALLWEKFSGDDNLSNDGTKAGQGLAAYVRERPEYAGRFRKVGSYLATKVLVADLRLGLWDAFRRDLRALRAAGLIGIDPLRLIRDHRAVRRYRRAMSDAAGLASLTGPPAAWQ
ncbi:MAG: glycosyltransferase family 2 protein [Xanthobacteraceae bacterium]|nr:glycosyltransferase family 2 protein [Xanthobacteraceae bacterium]